MPQALPPALNLLTCIAPHPRVSGALSEIASVGENELGRFDAADRKTYRAKPRRHAASIYIISKSDGS